VPAFFFLPLFFCDSFFLAAELLPDEADPPLLSFLLRLSPSFPSLREGEMEMRLPSPSHGPLLLVEEIED